MIRPVRWAESAEELYQRYRTATDRAHRKRLRALWLVCRGESARAAAQHAGRGERTVVRWLGWYRRGGLGAVLRRVPGHGARGTPGRLAAEQQRALVERASTGVFRTYAEAQQWVQQQYGVAYTYQGIYAALARLGVHPKVPRPVAAKADPAAQAAWNKGGSRKR